jgi:hypothetical protein
MGVASNGRGRAGAREGAGRRIGYRAESERRDAAGEILVPVRGRVQRARQRGARQRALDWPTTTTRGGIKIARRDAITLAEGIAALLQIVADARRESPSPPAPPDDGLDD